MIELVPLLKTELRAFVAARLAMVADRPSGASATASSGSATTGRTKRAGALQCARISRLSGARRWRRENAGPGAPPRSRRNPSLSARIHPSSSRTATRASRAQTLENDTSGVSTRGVRQRVAGSVRESCMLFASGRS